MQRMLRFLSVLCIFAASPADAGGNNRRHGHDDGNSLDELVYRQLLEQCYKRLKNGKRDCPDNTMLEQLGIGQQRSPDRGYYRQVPVDRCTQEHGPPQPGFYWQFSIETDDWGDPENVCTEIPY